MTIEQKIEVIKEFKEPAIAALERYLDSIYNLTDEYFDENGQLIKGLTPDEKLENFIKEMRAEAQKFEKVRHKLINSDFKLSLFEINLIAAAFLFVQQVWEKDIKKIQQASDEAIKVYEKLTSAIENNYLKKV